MERFGNAAGYVPEAGDIVWLNFTPQAGHEQAGHRPALVFESACVQLENKLDGLLSHDNTD